MLLTEAKQSIFDVLSKISSCELGEIGDNTNLIEGGYLDSLDSMTFVFELENKLGIKFPEKILFDESFFQISFLTNCVVTLKGL